MQGSKVFRISHSSLNGTDFCYPVELAEHALISEFFQTLDALIAANRLRLDHLKSLKRPTCTRCLPSPAMPAGIWGWFLPDQ